MRTVYLDNAATSYPKPPRVYERLRGYLEEFGGCPGRGSYELARQAESLVEDTRQCLAELFHASDPRRIVFTLNATDALNLAIKGTLRAGDHVVTTVLEHNSVARPLNRLERQGLIRVTRVGASPEGLIDPADIRGALTGRTRLVAVLHGSNVLGSLQPIGSIGRIVREWGALFLVDASQTAGAVPIDVEASQIDLLAFPGHKALLGLPGTGGLYVGPRAALSPWREGGTGVFSELPLQPDQLPYALEAGSPNVLGLAGLRESVRFILQYGVDWIRAHELSLAARLLDGLRGDERFTLYGPASLEGRVAVLSLTVAGRSPAQVAEQLNDRHRIAVRAGLHCAPGAHRLIGTFPDGTVRISPGYFTTEQEIELCLEALKEAASPAPHAASVHA
ncbi:MAG: aminotransferase class V-fold PLP-dependent enzyme [Candidatus Omnitrophica bacterium]|nr:aminotransferase class V-fold PLP-dependent enzyme [Candidatus Omnitrophota bacterium]